MARVVFTPTAKANLRQIRDYIAQDSPRAATRMVRRIRAAAGRLAPHPEMGRVVPEYDDDRIRELIVGSYRVVYRFDVAVNTVRIVGVIHGSRLLPGLLDSP